MFWVLLKQDLKNLWKNPLLVFLSTGYPIVLILLMGYLFSNQYSSVGITSYDFYGITMITFLVAGCVTVTPNAFMERTIKEPNLRIAYAPVSNFLVYASKVLASFLFIAVGMSVVIFFFDFIKLVNFGGEQIGFILILIWSLLLFVCLLGAVVCCYLRSEEMTNKILSLLMNFLAILAGNFFSMSIFGSWGIKISSISPILWINRAIFQIIYDGSFTLFVPVLSGLLMASCILMWLLHRVYRPEDFIAY